MKIEIWSDIVCPWCAIGKRRFESALERFDHRDDVEVVWRSFELDPTAPAERPESLNEHLAAKYGMSVAQAAAMHQQMTATAAQEGLDFRFDRARPGNTFDAHRLIHLAAEHGLQDAMKDRLLTAYFTEGQPIGDISTLTRLAGEVGVDEVLAKETLSGDAFADAVRADEAEASALGISGVPFFVVDRRYGVSGAQPADLLLEVLDKAWSQRQPMTMVNVDGDAACAEDNCAV